ncbi:MAG TPA: hypothetical protein VG602_07720 [Actinomycetota bacterium]|nr:hypothetical protein [Actinomycetota bacterium]
MKRLLAWLTCCLTVLPMWSGPVGAQEIVTCPMHGTHTGAHVRSSCQMTRLGGVEVSATAGIGQIETHGTLAAVVQREDGQVALVDIADPAAPRVVGRYDGNTGYSQLDDPFDGDVAFSTDGRYLFYARQTHQFSNDGLHVIDVADPTRPRRALYLPAGGSLRVAYHRSGDAEYVVIMDAIAGMVVYRFSRAGGASLVPVHVDALPALKVGGPASAGLFVDPRDPRLGIPLLYAANGETGLDVFDFSTPERPVKLGSWTAEGLADIEVAATSEGRTVYAATEYWFNKQLPPRIVVLDATDLSRITERLRFSPGDPDYPGGVNWRVQGIELAGGLLYVSHSHAGLGVLDTCCLTELPRAATTDLGDGNTGGELRSIAPYAMDVEVSNGVALVSDASTGTFSTFRLEPLSA